MESIDTDCPLSRREQNRNLFVFAGCTALQYLAAPVGYVGITQASLCKELGAAPDIANLPETAFLIMTLSPVIVVWLIPYISWLKRNLIACYSIAAVSMAAMALILVAPIDPRWKVAAVIVQGGILGAALPCAIAFLWEALGRGVAENRRGLGLALGFGFGPFYAMIGSLGSQLALAGKVGPIEIPLPPSPGNFAVLYACGVPVMLLAALLASRLIIPTPDREVVREPFVQAVLVGPSNFLRDPLLRRTGLVIVLLYMGNAIPSNMNLYSQEVFGDAPMLHAGYQNAVRFGFKMGIGLTLGWLLTRTNPKLGLLVTGAIFTLAVGAAMVADASTYLLVFGLYGAGELIGVYGPNYLLSASRKEDIRRNMAVVTMLMAPGALAAYLFGTIARGVGNWYDPTTGFRVSFAVCAGLMLVGLVLAMFTLPTRPGVTMAEEPPRSK